MHWLDAKRAEYKSAKRLVWTLRQLGLVAPMNFVWFSANLGSTLRYRSNIFG